MPVTIPMPGIGYRQPAFFHREDQFYVRVPDQCRDLLPKPTILLLYENQLAVYLDFINAEEFVRFRRARLASGGLTKREDCMSFSE